MKGGILTIKDGRKQDGPSAIFEEMLPAGLSIKFFKSKIFESLTD
jgi:hypothetical protein